MHLHQPVLVGLEVVDPALQSLRDAGTQLRLVARGLPLVEITGDLAILVLPPPHDHTVVTRDEGQYGSLSVVAPPPITAED